MRQDNLFSVIHYWCPSDSLLFVHILAHPELENSCIKRFSWYISLCFLASNFTFFFRKSKRRRRRVKESPLTSPTLVPTPESELIPVPSNGIADYPQDHDDSSLLTPSNHNGSSLSSHQTLLSSTQHSTSYSFLKQLIRKRYPPSSETESSPLSPKSYLQLLRDSFFSDRLRSTLRKQSRLFDQLKATDEGSLDALSDREGDSLASGGEVCAPNGGALLGEKSFVTMRDRKSTDLKTRLAKPSSRTLRSSTKSKTAAAKVGIDTSRRGFRSGSYIKLL